jgi:hypothetical protein
MSYVTLEYLHILFCEPGYLSLYSEWATGWKTEERKFDYWQGQGIYLFLIAPRPALGPTKPPIQWVPGALFLGEKWLRRETKDSGPSGA